MNFIFADQLFIADDPSMLAAAFKPTCGLALPWPLVKPSDLAGMPTLRDYGGPLAA